MAADAGGAQFGRPRLIAGADAGDDPTYLDDGRFRCRHTPDQLKDLRTQDVPSR